MSLIVYRAKDITSYTALVSALQFFFSLTATNGVISEKFMDCVDMVERCEDDLVIVVLPVHILP